MEVLLWALWIVAGGPVNSGRLTQPEIQAYFASAEECQRVGKIVANLAVSSDGENRNPLKSLQYQCVQAKYWVPEGAAGGARK